MSKAAAQTTDAAQSVGASSATSRDNDLKQTMSASAQKIANMDQRDTSNGKRPATTDGKA